jgi:metallo-beta-lactamase class B
MNRRHFALLLGSAVLLGTAAYAQGPQSPTAQDSKQKASQAAPAMDFEAWRTPTDPFHIVGPIYYVGTSGISVYLITTSAGHILLNGAIPGTAPLIEASIRKLGYKPEDIRILLISHAHFDHVGTLADLRKLTKAKVEVMQQDMDLLKSGGALDYLWANDARFHFPPVAADVALHDGDTVSLGGVTLTAHLTPRPHAGHHHLGHDGGGRWALVWGGFSRRHEPQSRHAPCEQPVLPWYCRRLPAHLQRARIPASRHLSLLSPRIF